jgi:putative transposase
MAEKFNDKFRIPSARLQNWDYSSAGVYFITICTYNRKHFFGECVKGKMNLSTIGLIVQGCWYDIPNHTSANIILDKFVIMPNHLHGILILGESTRTTTVETFHETSSDDKEQNDRNNSMKDGIPMTFHETSLPDENNNSIDRTPKTFHETSLPMKNKFFQKISPKSGSISRILGSFKSACSKHIKSSFPDIEFEWQERFWDNIIRNNESFETVSNYIINNPKNWADDKFFDE